MKFEDSYVGRLRAKVGNMKLILTGALVAIENEEGKILLQRMPGKDTYRLIGGMSEDNETLRECAIREVKEELNIDIKNLKIWGLRDRKDHIMFLENGHVVLNNTVLFHTKDFSGEIKLQEEEVAEVQWLDPNDRTIKMKEIMRIQVDAFLEYKRTGEFQYITNDLEKDILN